MSNAERAWPAGGPEGGTEIISVNFGHHQEHEQLEMESLMMGALLSDDSREYVMKLAQESKTNPFEIIESAVASYRLFCELIESGGRLYILNKNGQMLPISDGLDTSPAA